MNFTAWESERRDTNDRIFRIVRTKQNDYSVLFLIKNSARTKKKQQRNHREKRPHIILQANVKVQAYLQKNVPRAANWLKLVKIAAKIMRSADITTRISCELSFRLNIQRH